MTKKQLLLEKFEGQKHKVWFCKIGFANETILPNDADLWMRDRISTAFHDMTGKWPDFIFSGWGGELTDAEFECVMDDF